MEEITIIVDDLTESVTLVASTNSFLGLGDTPSTYVGQAGKTAVVNSGETAIEFTTPAGGGDMVKATYDPTNVNGDAFDYDNFINTPPTITAQQTTDIGVNNAKISYTDATAVGLNTAKVGVTNEEQNTINTELEAGMTGEDLVLNVLSLTTAEYGAGTPIATTFYIITDA